MQTPYLKVNLDDIYNNMNLVLNQCINNDITLTLVTKGIHGDKVILEMLLASNITRIADSYFKNIKLIKSIKPSIEIMLLRIPALSQLDDVLKYTDYSLQSELTIIKALNDKALLLSKSHRIILMVDVGDLREGYLKEDVLSIVGEIIKLSNIKLVGLATNVGCYGGIIPTYDNINILVTLKDLIAETYDLELDIISGGATSSLELINNKTLPNGINDLRIGEAILHGKDSTNEVIIKDLKQSTFILGAEILELKDKPSVPIGISTRQDLKLTNKYVDKGIITRALLNIGKQDVNILALEPLDSNVKILGCSSDLLLVELINANYQLGDVIEFKCNYSAMLGLLGSTYINKYYK